jgi:LysR family hydrogen peroxide-inducible transcriptional activator
VQAQNYPFTLRQLQYLVAVAEHGSFRKAAQACHVAQPSLSAQVAQVEDAIGVQIFRRETRRVTVSAAGEVLLERARTLLGMAQHFSDDAVRLADPLAATLRIGVIPTIAPYFLPEVTLSLHKTFPKMSWYWREEKTAELLEGLAQGTIDAALVAWTSEMVELEHVKLGDDPFVLACSREHVLGQSSESVRLRELDGQDVLLLDDGHCLREQALTYCQRAGTQELGLRATSLPTLVQMVASGQGVTLLPLLATPIENRNGYLNLRRFTAPEPVRTLALVWRKRAPFREVLRKVGGHLRGAYLVWLRAVESQSG